MTVKTYLLSVPERVARSVLGLGAGVAREVGEVALPDGIRHSRLYQNLVDTTLRYLIERVGGVEGVYDDEKALPASPGGPRATPSKCSASSPFEPRRSGSSRRWPTSAGWAGT